MVYHRWYQSRIFEVDLGAILDPRHELLLLSSQINWEEIVDRLLPYYSQRGRPAKKLRRMVGLHENLYWMEFGRG